jgi:hypothetical protein
LHRRHHEVRRAMAARLAELSRLHAGQPVPRERHLRTLESRRRAPRGAAWGLWSAASAVRPRYRLSGSPACRLLCVRSLSRRVPRSAR